MAGSLAILRGTTSLPVLSTAQSTITTSSPDRDSLTRPATSTGRPPEGRGSESSRGMTPWPLAQDTGPRGAFQHYHLPIPQGVRADSANSDAGHDDIPVDKICALHSTFVETLGEMACGGGGRVAIGGWRCVRVDASHRRRCGRCCWERLTVGLGAWCDTHADISPTSRQATAMYGIQVRISTVRDANENRTQPAR